MLQSSHDARVEDAGFSLCSQKIKANLEGVLEGEALEVKPCELPVCTINDLQHHMAGEGLELNERQQDKPPIPSCEVRVADMEESRRITDGVNELSDDEASLQQPTVCRLGQEPALNVLDE
jgi:hypothetical protein